MWKKAQLASLVAAGNCTLFCAGYGVFAALHAHTSAGVWAACAVVCFGALTVLALRTPRMASRRAVTVRSLCCFAAVLLALFFLAAVLCAGQGVPLPWVVPVAAVAALAVIVVLCFVKHDK